MFGFLFVPTWAPLLAPGAVRLLGTMQCSWWWTWFLPCCNNRGIRSLNASAKLMDKLSLSQLPKSGHVELQASQPRPTSALQPSPVAPMSLLNLQEAELPGMVGAVGFQKRSGFLSQADIHQEVLQLRQQIQQAEAQIETLLTVQDMDGDSPAIFNRSLPTKSPIIDGLMLTNPSHSSDQKTWRCT
eukprot:Skav227271  [mRNA]  locus=scaffold3803:72489:78377:- [translate_table: standard]